MVRYLEGAIAAVLAEELAAVAAALAVAWPERCQVTQVAQVTPSLLQERLMLVRPHIFHFAGHALVREGEAEHILVLAGEGGYADALPETTLAALLGAVKTRLAVLNACTTGAAGAERWSGLA